MTWISAVPAAALALMVFFIPGGIAGWIIGLRSTALIGFAPVLSASLLASATIVLGLFHVAWLLITVGVYVTAVLIVTAVVAALVRRYKRGRPSNSVTVKASDTRPVTLGLVTGAVIAAVLIGARFMWAVGDPTHISQTFDDVFHLNGVQYILATGDVSPITFGNLTHAYDGIGSFYPNLWHALTALVVQATGVSVPVGVSATNVVICAVIWPVSSLLLVRQVMGRKAMPLVIGGGVVASFAAFPLLLMSYGVLFPNALSVALLPAALAAAVVAARVGSESAQPPSMAWLTLVLCVPGIALAHPSSLVALIALSSPLYLVMVGRWWRDRAALPSRRIFVSQGLALLAAAVVAIALILALRPSRAGASWGPSASVGQALQAVLLTSQLYAPPAVVTSVLLILGVVAMFVMRRQRWLIVSLLIAETLYVLAAVLPVGGWRYLLTGTWYSDVPRLVALLPVVMAPVVVFGIWALSTAVAKLVRGRALRSVVVALACLSVGGFAVCIMQLGAPMAGSSRDVKNAYAEDAEAPLLSTSEAALLERVRRETPPNSVIVGNPWTGASLVWAIAGRRALLPHIYGDRTKDTLLILDQLRNATPGSSVCAAINREHVDYVLDFGERGVFGKSVIRGLEDLSASHAVTLIDSQGKDARLYQVTGC